LEPCSGSRLTEFAPAKVNLFLHVVGRRPDGYHLLDSLVVFADVGDTLEAVHAPELSLSVEGPFAGALGDMPDNLALRATRMLADYAGIVPRLALTLVKRLPVAAGIGGGSADAAATLRLLGRLWGVAGDELAALAPKLGADVPVCLAGVPASMTGVGEKLAPAPALPGCGLLLVNPKIALATADVFRARVGPFSAPAQMPPGWDDAGAMAAFLATLNNDLEPAAVAFCPEIGEVLRTLSRLPGCLLARMSGSGTTCFGLFTGPATAQSAAKAITARGWWTWGGRLATSPLRL
jgi:4-diphosphocytidyl-2-C-methyl-D-erythritol kinase